MDYGIYNYEGLIEDFDSCHAIERESDWEVTQKVVSLCCAKSLSSSENLAFHSAITDLKEKEFLLVCSPPHNLLVGKIKGTWKYELITSHACGGNCDISLTDSFALRRFSAPFPCVDSRVSYEWEALQRINPDGTAIGIVPPPLGYLKGAYLLGEGYKRIYTEKSGHHVNKRFKSDLKKAEFTVQEVPKICAHIALGLETMKNAYLHHLDIKPDNILYDGDGKACLSDFDGVIKAGFFDFFLKNLIVTPRMVNKADVNLLESSWFFSKIASQMDIFSLGSTFYLMAALIQSVDKKEEDLLPYSLSEGGYAETLLDGSLLKAVMEPVYTEKQIDMILRMLEKDPNKRPSIQEVVSAFPMI